MFLCISCGGKNKADAASVKNRTPNKIKGVVSYKRTFGDLNDLHLSSATKRGIVPLDDREEAEMAKNKLLKVAPNGYYAMDSLTHSIPYLIPSASVLLTKIATNFQDSLKAKGLCSNRIIVTSVLRTKDDVKRLRRRNGNASLNSAHFYGTTFDIGTTLSNLGKIGNNTLVDLQVGDYLGLNLKNFSYYGYSNKIGVFTNLGYNENPFFIYELP